MTSGKGVYTDKGRCYFFWTEYLTCQGLAEIPAIDCIAKVDDYLECLHRTKEVKNWHNFLLEREHEKDH